MIPLMAYDEQVRRLSIVDTYDSFVGCVKYCDEGDAILKLPYDASLLNMRFISLWGISHPSLQEVFMVKRRYIRQDNTGVNMEFKCVSASSILKSRHIKLSSTGQFHAYHSLLQLFSDDGFVGHRFSYENTAHTMTVVEPWEKESQFIVSYFDALMTGAKRGDYRVDCLSRTDAAGGSVLDSGLLFWARAIRHNNKRWERGYKYFDYSDPRVNVISTEFIHGPQAVTVTKTKTAQGQYDTKPILFEGRWPNTEAKLVGMDRYDYFDDPGSVERSDRVLDYQAIISDLRHEAWRDWVDKTRELQWGSKAYVELKSDIPLDQLDFNLGDQYAIEIENLTSHGEISEIQFDLRRDGYQFHPVVRTMY